MKRKFYIPTSSLNFNSIVASESISPAAYYKEREYGICRFVDIFEGRCPYVVIMSNKMCKFTRPYSDLEDHPMLIEVFMDDADINSLGNGLYSVRRTLYVTPYNTNFIFFSKQDLETTKSLTFHSSEVKLSSDYLLRMRVENPVNNYRLDEVYESGGAADMKSNVSMDKKLDRLKGLLTGYYVGGMLSTSKNNIERMLVLYDVQETFSSAISAGGMDGEVEQKLRQLSDKWMRLWPEYSELMEICNGDEQLFSAFANYCKKYKMSMPFRNLGLSQYVQHLTRRTLEGEVNPAMVWISEELESYNKKGQVAVSKVLPNDSKIIIDGAQLMGIDGTGDSELVKYWVNNLLLNDKLPMYDKMVVADKVTDATIVFCGERWAESTERVFLNKLRKHIGGGEPFDVEWNNGALCSIAAVVLRGKEWDELLNFMQRKGMYDYRLAFALFGVVTGYAGLTRDFVDELYDSDKKYGTDVYREFYGQLFGQELPQCPIRKKVEPVKDVDSKACSDIVNKITNHPDYKKEKHEKYCNKIVKDELVGKDEIRALSTSRDGWKGLIDKVFPSGKRGFKSVVGRQSSMIFNNEMNFNNNQSGYNVSTFPSTNTNNVSIIDDDMAKDIIRDSMFIPQPLKSELVEMFVEFQIKYRKGGYYANNAKQYHRNNNDVVDHFTKWCLSVKNGRHIEKTLENSKIMDELKRELLKKYHD